MIRILLSEAEGMREDFEEREVTDAMVERLESFSEFANLAAKEFEDDRDTYNLLISLSTGANALISLDVCSDDVYMINHRRAFFDYANYALGRIATITEPIEEDEHMALYDIVKAYLNLDDKQKNMVRTMLIYGQKGGDDDDAD